MQALAAEGWSVKRIAKELGRSQDCVARNLRRLQDDEEEEDFDADPINGDWPVPTTMPESLMPKPQVVAVGSFSVPRSFSTPLVARNA